MKRIRHLLVLLAAAACTHAGAQTTGAASRSAVAESNAAVFKACAETAASNAACPLDATFGLVRLAPNNEVLDFRVSNTVPLAVGQGYGWALKLNRKNGKVRVLERMTLPEAPKTWGTGGQAHGMSADRKTLSLDATLTVYDGTISKAWDVVKGDPPGRYLISVYVEGSAPVQFEFEVVAPR